MNRILLLTILLVPLSAHGVLPNFNADYFQNYTSQTFMMPLPVYHNTPATLGRWGTILAQLNGNNQTACSVTPIYQWSRTWDRSAPYFLMNCKETLFCAGDAMGYNQYTRDLRAEWFGLPDTFSGTLTCKPWQRVGGAVISFSQGFGKWTDWKIFKDWWLEIAVPIISVKQNLRPQASDNQLTNALASLRYNAGRMVGYDQQKTGVPSVRAILGATIVDDTNFVLVYHGGLEIPTESRVLPTTLFAPFLGSNGHISFLNGVFARLNIHTFASTCCSAQIFASLEHHYYLERDQTRVFDLFNKQWSRYLPVRREGELTTIPATNILTRRVTVRPGGFSDLSFGFALAHQNAEFEFGYALWAHHHERINWPEKPYCDKGIDPLDVYGIAGTTAQTSANASTIAHQAANDTAFTPIGSSQIDLFSGISRGVLVNRIFIHGSYKGEYKNGNMYLGLGGTIDFPRENSALRTAQIWAKIGSQF